jgi:hypothetical protein
MTRWCILSVAALAGSVLAQSPTPKSTRTTPPLLPPLTPSNPTDGPGAWSDNFDTYAANLQLIGSGGWQGWPNYPQNNPTGFTSTAFASSAPNSLRIAMANPAATPATDQTDMVHQYTISGGQWTFRTMTYMPSSATNAAVQYPKPYFILMRDFEGAANGVNHWGMQTHFDKATALVVEDDWLGGGTGVAGNTFTPQPLILDQWVELRAVINLDTPGGGEVKVYYNNALVADHKWHDAPGTNPAPPYTLKAVDVYNNGISEFYFDTMSLSAGTGTPCYANCDGSTTAPVLTVNDFVCFQSAFAAGDSYANCDGSTTVPVLTVNDFVCFQSAFAAGCP